MDSTLLAARAVATYYARGILWTALAIGLGVYGLLMVLIGWIATAASNWWWLLAIIPTSVLAILWIVWMVVFVLVRRLSPGMTAKRRAATKKVVDRINNAAELAGTPKFMILYRIIKDILAPPSTVNKTYIGEVASEPGELKRAFEELRKLF